MVIVLFLLVFLIFLLGKNIKQRRIKILSLLVLFLIIVLLTWENGVKSYYCLTEDKCITVWKSSNGEVYIIYGKYQSNKKPKDDYVKIDSKEEFIDIIFIQNDRLLVDTNTSIQKKSTNNKIELYSDNKKENDSLYTYFDGNYTKYKKNIDFISINIKENYAMDKNGKKLNNRQ